MVRWILVLAAACSSGRGKAVEDTRVVTPPRAPGDAAPAPVAATGNGDVQVRVEWHDVPAAKRASPGRTACGTARASQVSPTTTWGIPDVFVTIDGRAANAAEPHARVVYDHCALSPRVVVAGKTLAVTSTASEPVQLAIARRYDVHAPATATGAPEKPILLPIAGHEVDVELEPGGWYQLAHGDESAWILAAPNADSLVTDAAGQATFRDVPAGHHVVTAWLPGGAARGEVTVTAGALAEVTLDLAK